MAEKIIFEYRAEQQADGYHYTLSRDGQRIEIKSTLPLKGFAGRERRARWARRFHRHMGRCQQKSRQAVRKTLDAFEGMYQDIYGGAATGQETAE